MFVVFGRLLVESLLVQRLVEFAQLLVASLALFSVSQQFLVSLLVQLVAALVVLVVAFVVFVVLVAFVGRVWFVVLVAVVAFVVFALVVPLPVVVGPGFVVFVVVGAVELGLVYNQRHVLVEVEVVVMLGVVGAVCVNPQHVRELLVYSPLPVLGCVDVVVVVVAVGCWGCWMC